ncbi:MAG: putative spore-coat protein [Eubacterium sp.]|nr:putative spore-coat protein [Eubacterium sp.]
MNNMNSNMESTSNMNNMMEANTNVQGLQLSDREKMLMTVQAYEFALVEIGLFLDTHPNDRTALAYFKQYRELKHRAESEYTRRFGPITMDHMDNDLSTWRWIENPWPWEIGSEG